MSDLNKRQKYALELRKGCSDREAAERAGFSGRPGPDARRLADVVSKVAGSKLGVERRETIQKIERHRFEIRRLERKIEAIEALEAEGGE